MYFSFKPNEGAKLQWKTAIRELARAMDKDDPKGIQKLARLSAKRFVQNVIAVTPPCQGVADQASKARGEQTILSDLLRLAQPVSLAATPRQLRNEVVATEDDLLAVYLAARDPRTGRVNPRNRKQPLYIDQFAFNRVLKKLQSHVGWLAAGLNNSRETV